MAKGNKGNEAKGSKSALKNAGLPTYGSMFDAAQHRPLKASLKTEADKELIKSFAHEINPRTEANTGTGEGTEG